MLDSIDRVIGTRQVSYNSTLLLKIGYTLIVRLVHLQYYNVYTQLTAAVKPHTSEIPHPPCFPD